MSYETSSAAVMLADHIAYDVWNSNRPLSGIAVVSI